MDQNAVKRDVDGARAAATRVEEAQKKAVEIKSKALQLIYEKDEWTRQEKAQMLLEEAQEVKQEARTAYQTAGEHRHAVVHATIAHAQNARRTIAQRAAECAYNKANAGINIVVQLVSEVREICKDACRQLGEC